MIRRLALSAALIGASTFAWADDLAFPLRGPFDAATPAYNWTGFYVGANGGYAWGQQNLNALIIDGKSFSLSGVNGLNGSTQGALAGGTIGANLEYDQVVFGLEGDLDWANIRGARTLQGAALALDDKINDFGTVRGRLGYAFGQALIYVTGGLYWQPTNESLVATTDTGQVGLSGKTNAFGWTIGGGVEYALSANWSAKVEYLYARAGNASFNYNGPNGAVLRTANDDSISMVRTGLNYRF
jgi:outer membrane immunogenic protein